MKNPIIYKLLSVALVLLFSWHTNAQTWIAQTSGTTQNLWQVQFLDSTTGYACGESGTVIKTTNGGTNWSAVNINTTNPVRDIYFVSTTEGWAAVGDVNNSSSSGEIWHTSNGGLSWTKETPSSTEARLGISFVDANTGWGVGSKNGAINIDATTNGGSNWSNQSDNNIFGWLYKIEALSSNVAYAIGVTFFPSATGMIVKTTNGGSKWNQNTTGTIPTPNGIDMTDTANGFVAGDGGMIMHTTNGGANWNTQTSGTTDTLMDVSFATGSIGWTCGYSGTILNTVNAGTNWNARTSGTTENLNGIFALDTANVWAVGDNGTIRKRVSGTNVNSLEKEGTTCRIYPNPFSGSTTINISNNVALRNAVLLVYDAAGRKVIEQKVTAHNFTLQRGPLVTGTYSYVVYNNSTNIAHGKIAVE